MFTFANCHCDNVGGSDNNSISLGSLGSLEVSNGNNPFCCLAAQGTKASTATVPLGNLDNKKLHSVYNGIRFLMLSVVYTELQKLIMPCGVRGSVIMLSVAAPAVSCVFTDDPSPVEISLYRLHHSLSRV